MTLLFLAIIGILVYYVVIYKDNRTQNYSIKKCSNCHNNVEHDYNVCPICKETLRRKCQNCGSMLDIHWNHCPYCERTILKGEKQ